MVSVPTAANVTASINTVVQRVRFALRTTVRTVVAASAPKGLDRTPTAFDCALFESTAAATLGMPMAMPNRRVTAAAEINGAAQTARSAH